MEQQAWILRSFLAQLESQEPVDEGEPNGILGEFARLKSQSTKFRTDKTYPSKTAEKQENIKKNRYKDIIPFDHSRVKLTLTTTKNDTDYINANFIKVVVMACREFEMGKKKCERYWPQREEQPFVCEPFTVYCDSEENKGDYLSRILRVTFRNCSRTLKQLHYINWPDHGVPDSIPPILEMLDEMRAYQSHDDIPICIHCSAGCGRTGVLCVIDYTWNLLKKQMITPDFNIYDLVQNMRTQRPSVVQTKVSMVPRPITPDSESDTEFDLLERDFLPQYRTTSPHAPENLIVFRAEDQHMDRQQWHLLCAFPDNALMGRELQEGARTSPTQVHMSQRAAAAEEKEGREESEDIPSLKPPPVPAMPEAICLMVEDPYFDTPMSSPSSEVVPVEPAEDTKEWTFSPIFNTPLLCVNNQSLTSPVSDEEAPPPLPERTAASYELAVDTECSHPSERLSVIIPPNAAAEAVRELRACTPSPVPPLPERTPESFELATDQAPVEQRFKDAPPVDLSRIGMSSEWSGFPQQLPRQLRTSPNPGTSCTFCIKYTFKPPSSPPTSASIGSTATSIGSTPAPIDSTPASIDSTPAPIGPASPAIGSTSHPIGSTSTAAFSQFQSSRTLEPLSVAQQLTPSPVVVAGAGSAPVGQHEQVNRCPSLNAETPGSKSDKGNERGMCRAKSLKFFRHKQKRFGNRFGKPKGPRNYPETWI
ncbi:hypothetical protein INR49_000053 [Caranx melampygus]|nr:hypothetical protein INR49_000053 [Caranx melampygus]